VNIIRKFSILFWNIIYHTKFYIEKKTVYIFELLKLFLIEL